MTVTFIETQFPPDISYKSKGGSGFSTTIFETTAGFEQRNINWSKSKGKWDISYGIKNLDQMNLVIEMFMAVQGKAIAFRFKDWGDYQIGNQQIGVGDGTTASFQIVKVYTDANSHTSFTRIINKPVNGTLQTLTVAGTPKTEGTHFNIDYTTGIVTFTSGNIPTSSQIILITYIEFDVPARFDTDELDISQEFFEVESWDNIPIVEVRLS